MTVWSWSVSWADMSCERVIKRLSRFQLNLVKVSLLIAGIFDEGDSLSFLPKPHLYNEVSGHIIGDVFVRNKDSRTDHRDETVQVFGKLASYCILFRGAGRALNTISWHVNGTSPARRRMNNPCHRGSRSSITLCTT